MCESLHITYKNNINNMRYYEKGITFLDNYSIRKELRIGETTLIRLLKKLDIKTYPYKNQNLIKESDFNLIAEAILKNKIK